MKKHLINIDNTIKCLAKAKHRYIVRGGKLISRAISKDDPITYNAGEELYDRARVIPYHTSYWYLFEERRSGKKFVSYGNADLASNRPRTLMEIIDEDNSGMGIHTSPYGKYATYGRNVRYDIKRYKKIHQTADIFMY